MSQHAEDDFHGSELSRRSIQISDLQEELDGGRDRARQAEERSAALERQMEKLKVEISVRKSKTQEMDDQVAADEVVCLENQNRLQEAAEAARAELLRLQAELVAAEAAVEQAEAEAEARKAAEALEEEDKRRAAEEAEQANQLAAAEEGVKASQADVEHIQASLRDLELNLNLEKNSTRALTSSVAEAEEKRDAARAECERLSAVLEALSSKGELQRLREVVASKDAEQLQLTQELANKKSEGLMQRQSIQGALDETRRMSEARRQQLEQTRQNTSSSLLMTALEEAKLHAEASRKRRTEVEEEAANAEREVSNLQGQANRDQLDVEHEHYESLKKELHSVREDLDSARRRLCRSDEAAEQSRRSLLLAQGKSKRSIEVLRSKLEELWRGIQSLPV